MDKNNEPKFDLVRNLECKKCGFNLFEEAVVLSKVKNSNNPDDVRVAANKIIVCKKCGTPFIPEDALKEPDTTNDKGIVKPLFN